MIWTPHNNNDLNEEEARVVISCMRIVLNGLESNNLVVNPPPGKSSDYFANLVKSAIHKLTSRDDGRQIPT